MNTPKAILIGFALVAAAVYFSRDVGPAQAAIGAPNFSIVSAGEIGSFKLAWVLNTISGQMKMCLYGTKVMKAEEAVSCLPWFRE